MEAKMESDPSLIFNRIQGNAGVYVIKLENASLAMKKKFELTR
jgi:hypothetical protein